MAEISFRQKIIKNNVWLLSFEERALKFGVFIFFLKGIENMIRDVLYSIICFMQPIRLIYQCSMFVFWFFRSSKNQYRGAKLLVYYSD